MGTIVADNVEYDDDGGYAVVVVVVAVAVAVVVVAGSAAEADADDYSRDPVGVWWHN